MKRRLTLISLLLIFCINLPVKANFVLESTETSVRKIYIILRSEQNQDELTKFKSIVHNNLQYNNVNSQIETFRVNQAIPQMKIFKSAYQENYDYILLIDQIAKYSVGISNKKVTVGSKYQIQSYSIKSSNPSWKNHGDTNCNIAVDESVNAFSKRILNTIGQNVDESSFANISTSTYQYSSSLTPNNTETDQEKELELLEAKLQLQKTKTRRVQSEIELLILEANKNLVLESEKLKKLEKEIEKLKQQ